MDINNLTNVYNQNPTLQGQYTLQQYLDLFGGSSTTTPPTTSPPTTSPPNQGIIGSNINQYQTGGGDGYNPYQPNANVNTKYTPNYDYRKSLDYNPEVSDLHNQKIMQNTANYKGYDYYNAPKPTGFSEFINKAVNYIPYIGPLKRGAEFAKSALTGMLPVNKRGILENELRGSGIYTDNIGRLALGPGGKYNTPEGIMAGYNAYHMDPTKENNAWDRRTDSITDSLVDKAKDLGLNITKAELMDIAKEIEETGEYTGEYTDETFGVKNLFSNLTHVNMNKFMFGNRKQKSQDIIDFEVEKQKKEKERKRQEKIQNTIQKGLDEGKSLSQIGKENFTGEGMAFEAGNIGKGSFTGGKTQSNVGGVPGGKYGSPRKDGGLIGYNRGGLASMFTRRR